MSTSLRYTSRDLEGLPDIDGVRYEIIDGELYVSKAVNWQHQYASDRASRALVDWNDKTGTGLSITIPGLIFAPDEDVIPDIVWIRRDRLSAAFDEAGHLRIAPDLVVEILSPGAANERRDREFKLKLYSRQGVHEYWIVDWSRRRIQVYRRDDAALQLIATLESGDTLRSPLLEGFAHPVEDLWAPTFQ